MNPVQSAEQAALNRAIQATPPAVRAAIVSAGLQDARSVLPVPLYSTVRLSSTIAANVATVAQGPRKAFQYAVGQDMSIAGFAAATIAQYCDTNLLRAGETLDGANVWIWGLAAELCNNSDPRLAALIWREAVVELSLNGTTSIKLGPLSAFPSAGGLYGAGQSALLIPSEPISGPSDGGPGANYSFCQNGNPMGGNFLKFPQPFKWAKVGDNDSSLSVIVTTNRTITVPLAATRAAAAGTTGAWTQPSTGDAGTYVDIRFRLISVSVSPRSVNT